MKRGTRGEPDQKSMKNSKATGMEVQSPGKQEGQVCVVENDDHNYSRQHLPSGSKTQDAVLGRREGSNQRLVNDEELLLRVLPEEIWLLVFEELDNSDDLESVSNSSLYFRELLLSQRVKFLFKNVWKIIGWKYEKCFTRTDDEDDDVGGNEEGHVDGGNDDDESNEADGGDTDDENDDLSDDDSSDVDLDEDTGWQSALMFSEPKGAIKEALILRLVCRSWSKDIDKLYEECNVKLESMEQLSALLSYFEATHGSMTNTRSPFLGRKFTIEFDFMGGHEFVKGIRTILKKYGQHFLQCRFIVFDMPTPALVTLTPKEYCLRFRGMLQKIPNLRRLEIIHEWFPSWEPRMNNLPTQLRSNEVGVLEAEINAEPVLPLQELQELTVNQLPLPIFRQLIFSTGHMPTSATALAHVVADQAGLDGPFVSNLKSLSILHCPQNVFETIIGTQFDWQLTKLDLDLSQCSFTAWESIFNTAFENKFGNALTELSLQLPVIASKEVWDRIFKMSKNYKLHLSQLTQLDLTLFVGNLPCMDFLLPMKDSLRNLYITVEDQPHLEQWMERFECYDAGVVEIWSCFEWSPLESNVWTLFPNLEVFQIKDYAEIQHRTLNFPCNRRRWRMQMQEAMDQDS